MARNYDDWKTEPPKAWEDMTPDEQDRMRDMDDGPELPCEREWDEHTDNTGAAESGWWCVNDHTGCLWNDGSNTCGHPGESLSPLED